MHFNALVSVELPAPVEAEIEGETKRFTRFLRSVGLNASGETEAVRLAESFALGHEVAGSRALGTELFTVDLAEIPEHIREEAIAPLEVVGVYWSSGRIYG